MTVMKIIVMMPVQLWKRKRWKRKRWWDGGPGSAQGIGKRQEWIETKEEKEKRLQLASKYCDILSEKREKKDDKKKENLERKNEQYMNKQMKDLVEEGESSIEIFGVSRQSFIAGDKKEDKVAVLEIAGTKSITQDVKEKRDLDTDICETDISNGNNSDAVSVITIDSSNSQEDTNHNVMTNVMYIVYKEDVIKLAKEKF